MQIQKFVNSMEIHFHTGYDYLCGKNVFYK